MRNRLSYVFAALVVFTIGGAGCEIWNPAEELPIYLKIQQPEVEIRSDLVAEGGVKDVYVFQDENLVGTFPVPATIPILAEPGARIFIAGGVFGSGLSINRQLYPFWRGVDINLNVERLDTFQLRPRFVYQAVDTAITFAFVDRFEGTILFENALNTTDPLVTLQRTSESFEGNSAAEANFSASADRLEVISNTSLPLPRPQDNRIFVEITYRGDVPFTTGLFFQNFTNRGELGGVAFFREQESWTTVYVELTDGVASQPAGTEFRLFLRASSNGQTGRLLFDNIRIVHFL